MCSCGLSGKTTFTQIATRDGSSLPFLKYTHCRFKDQFESLFASIGIVAKEDNLKLLAYAADTGSDKKGLIKNPKTGRPIVFSVEEVISRIDTTRVGNESCTVS